MGCTGLESCAVAYPNRKPTARTAASFRDGTRNRDLRRRRGGEAISTGISILKSLLTSPASLRSSPLHCSQSERCWRRASVSDLSSVSRTNLRSVSPSGWVIGILLVVSAFPFLLLQRHAINDGCEVCLETSALVPDPRPEEADERFLGQIVSCVA